MHWIPETLLSDSALLDTFIGAVPREYDIHAKVTPVPGKELRQIVIEMPKGYAVLNYAENHDNKLWHDGSRTRGLCRKSTAFL